MSAKLGRHDLRDRERLSRLLPGGSPQHPVPLESASLVEVRARSTPCAICDAEVRVLEHEAKIIGGAPLRVVHTSCPACGHERVLYFSLHGGSPALPN